jgi:hypothetical protein
MAPSRWTRPTPRRSSTRRAVTFGAPPPTAGIRPRSDRFTPDSTFGYQRSYRDPTWVNNSEHADPTFSPDRQDLAFAQDAPGKRADGVYVWSLRRGCTGTARRIARGAVDPDWGPR